MKRYLFILIVFWFAAIDSKGEIQYFNYSQYDDCVVVQKSYARIGIKTTKCLNTEGGINERRQRDLRGTVS